MFLRPNKEDSLAEKYRRSFLTENPDYRGHLRQVSIPDIHARYLTAVIRLAEANECPLADYLGNIIAEHIRNYKDTIGQMIENTPKPELPKF